MANRNYNEQTLKEVIRQMLAKSGLEKKYDQMEVVQCYRELMGPVISKHTTEAFMRDKRLVLKIDSGALREELLMSKSRVIQLINEHFGQIMVEELELR